MSVRKFISKKGVPALTIGIVLGALIIMVKLEFIDLETVEKIKENPYSQYVIGLEYYRYHVPFYASTLTYFRKCFKHDDLATL